MSDRKNPWADPEAVRAHKLGCQIAARRRSKYNAKPQVVDGIKFDSKREAMRWGQLQFLLRGKQIAMLERQIAFVIAPAVKLHGEARKKPALRYVADFRYYVPSESVWIVEDAKGRETPVSRIKRHLMKSVHNIDVRIT